MITPRQIYSDWLCQGIAIILNDQGIYSHNGSSSDSPGVCVSNFVPESEGHQIVLVGIWVVSVSGSMES